MEVAVFVKATQSSEAGTLPGEQLLADMGRYNEATVNAGIMKAGEGLKPSSLGARVRFSGANRLITDGPIAETREVLGGYYLIFARNQSECLAIASEHPGADVGAVEVREVFDLGSTATVGKSR